MHSSNPLSYPISSKPLFSNTFTQLYSQFLFPIYFKIHSQTRLYSLFISTFTDTHFLMKKNNTKLSHSTSTQFLPPNH
nr:MAG TPA: hypothetical protein [Bacteriophage sp.]